MQELGGSTARQTAQAGRQKYSIPGAAHSVYGWGEESALLISVSSNSLLSGTSNFFRNFARFTLSRFRDCCSGTDCELMAREIVLCRVGFAYSLSSLLLSLLLDYY